MKNPDRPPLRLVHPARQPEGAITIEYGVAAFLDDGPPRRTYVDGAITFSGSAFDLGLARIVPRAPLTQK